MNGLKKFEEKGIPVIGDDVKSQIGATIIHRKLVKLFIDRGVKIDRTYQLNTGGNTDFLNMLNRERLVSKKISKTEAVQSMLRCADPVREYPYRPIRLCSLAKRQQGLLHAA